MSVIWKFVPENKKPGVLSISAPAGTKLLSCGLQENDLLVVWGEVGNTNATYEEIDIPVRMTGHFYEMRHGERFLGTVTYPNGIVAHIYCCE